MIAEYYDDLRSWQDKAGRIAAAGGKVPARPKLPGIAGMWRGPSQFFNGKIAPVVPHAVRGAIWCQGTSNGGDGRIYASRMEALVRGWRDAWDMPDMPFYFTQQQCYGAPDPDKVGFADLRQAQHLFFTNNRKNVGMVVQTDLNSARPQGIHYFNKLHPGMRMARWALAKQYGRDIAYTGPIYQGYRIEGDRVVVSFEKGSLFGGLMVGSKGMAENYREPGEYVEPAEPTPGEALNHFRLRGKDGEWHAAEAEIVGDVWYLTGSTELTPGWPYDRRADDAERPDPMPLVREFRRKTKASSFPTPRKRRFETGGGKYRSSWETADYSKGDEGVTTFAYHFAKTLDRPGVPQGFVTMSSGRDGRSRQLASPLSWTSFDGVKDVEQAAFRARLDELFLQYPQTAVAKRALASHIGMPQAFGSS